jgi:hypothetical protein
VAVAFDGPGCGVEEHHDACLCDVRLTERSLVRVSELADLPYVRGTVRRLSVGVPWRSEDFEQVMRIVLRAHDLKQERGAEARQRREVRIDARRAELLQLHESGLTLSEVLVEFDVTFDEWRDIFLPGKHNPMHSLALADWLALERDVRGGRATIAECADKWRVASKTMYDALHWLGLSSYLAQTRRDKGLAYRLTGEEREQLRQWIREGRSPAETKALMWSRYGVEISPSLVSHTRRRMTAKGDL